MNIKNCFLLFFFFFFISNNILAENHNSNKEEILKDMDNLLENNELRNQISNLKNQVNDQKIIHHTLEEEKEKNNSLIEENLKLKDNSLLKINSSTAIFITCALLFLIIIILYLSIIISRQRKWRYKYFDENDGKNFIGRLPENISDTIDNNYKAYKELGKLIELLINNSNQNLKINESSINKINEQLSTIRSYGEEKDKMVKKYQKFYDLGTLKRFIFEIIASIDSLENSIKKLSQDEKNISSINAIELAKDRLIILLENENIDQINPNKELKFNDPKQPIICKAIDKTITENTLKFGMINSVIHSGYNGKISEDGEVVIIREAWVNVYVQPTLNQETTLIKGDNHE